MKTACAPFSPLVSGRLRGFTLIEIMVVVAIIGLLAAIGLPSIITAVQKTGMRAAVSNVLDVCKTARANAIIHNRTESVIFYPAERRFAAENGAAANSGLVSAATLPDGVKFDMLDINQQDYFKSDWAKVFFYPDGTSDELTLILESKSDVRKITVEFSTGIPTVSDVNR